MVQRADHLDVVAGHDHLLLSIRGTLRPRQPCADISGTDEELRRVVGHERSVTATLVLGQNLQDRSVGVAGRDDSSTYVDLGLKLLHRLHRTGSDDDLATLKLLTLDTTEQSTHVVAGFTTVQLLVERLCMPKLSMRSLMSWASLTDTSQDRGELGAQPKDLNLVTLVDDTTLNLPQRLVSNDSQTQK